MNFSRCLADGTTLKYLSRVQDKYFSFYCLGVRFYDPEIGRFLQEDPVLGNLLVPASMNRWTYCQNDPISLVDPNGEFSFSDWWDSHWKEVAIVALCVATVVTAGAFAPLALLAIGIEVSATVCIATALVSAGVGAGAIYALSGGKASFSQIMGAFVAGGVAGAFLPGIGGALSQGNTIGAMAMGGLSGLMGNVYGEVTRNIAGIATDRSFVPTYDPRGTAYDMMFGAATALVPGGEYVGGRASGIGIPRNYYWQIGGEMEGIFTKAGSLRAIYNPLKPSGRYFYASTIFDAGTAPVIGYWLGNLPNYLSPRIYVPM